VTATAIAAMAVTVWILAIASHCGLLRPESVAAQSFQPAQTSLNDRFAASIGAPQLDDGSTACHYAFANAVLPKSTSAPSTAVGVGVAVAAVVGSESQRALRCGRSPPYGPAESLTGQDLLTRLCLSRR
jgi:hypothetical protein